MALIGIMHGNLTGPGFVWNYPIRDKLTGNNIEAATFIGQSSK